MSSRKPQIASTTDFQTGLVVFVRSVVPPSGKQLVTMAVKGGTTRTLQLKAVQPKRRCEEAPTTGESKHETNGCFPIAEPRLTIGFQTKKQPINKLDLVYHCSLLTA